MSDALRAGIYTRISLAVMGDTTKTDDQERQCRELCERRGWEVAEVFTDPSRSAWKRDRQRPGWDALLAAVGAGRFGAIVTYWGDRLVRQPRDLEDLLDLREVRSIMLASIAGQYDFDNPDHRMMMRWEVARACNESDNISRRRKAGLDRLRREGKVRPGGRGGRALGFEKDGLTHRPAETAVIREACARILDGESAGLIARDLTGRGFRTTAGSLITQGTIAKTLQRPRYAGLMPDGVSPAAWEPVLERGDWEMMCAVLAAKAAGFGYATNARRYLLSGIAECGACGSPLQIRQSKSGAAKGYGCVAPGCLKVYRSQVLLDAYVTGRVLARLANPGNPEVQVEAYGGHAAELAILAERRAETEAFIAGLADAPGQRIEILSRALDSFDAKIGAIREAMAGSAGARLLRAHAGISREDFGGLPLEVRRALVRASFRVQVLPASKRGPGFRESDVSMTPADRF